MIIGIIAAAAGPALNTPATIDVITMIAITKSFVFEILLSISENSEI